MRAVMHRPIAAPRRTPLSRRVLTLLLVLAALLLLTPTLPSLAVPPRTVTLVDEQDRIPDPDHVLSQAERIDFRSEVDLVWLTIDVTAYGRSSIDDRALNDAVLLHAREKNPEWIDGDVWADGLVIIAIDQENRFVGTYAGEDVKLSDRGYEAVQEAMSEDAAAGRTSGALLTGTQKYAALLHRPFWQAPIPLAVIGVTALVLALVGIGGVSRRGAARRDLQQGRTRLHELRVQEAQLRSALGSLPADSYYAGQLRDLAERRTSAMTDAEGADDRIPDRPGLAWGTRGPDRETARTLAASAAEAQESSALLLAGAELMTRSGDWSRQWSAEIRPLENAAARIEAEFAPHGWTTFTDHDEPATREAQETLRAAAGEVDARLPEITRDVHSGAMTPDQALEALDELTEALSAAVIAYARTRIAANARDDMEEEMMHAASRAALREIADEAPPTSVRALGAPRTSEIDPTAENATRRMMRAAWATGLDPLGFLGHWRIDGPGYLREHRASAHHRDARNDSGSRHSSSTSGYSVSSSFRGSGSSSRF